MVCAVAARGPVYSVFSRTIASAQGREPRGTGGLRAQAPGALPTNTKRRSDMIDAKMVTTALDLPGYRVARYLGVVRGIIVRSRSIVGNIGAGLQTLLGGNSSIYTTLCEKSPEDAFRVMIEHAAQLGANAVIGVRDDANEIRPGVTEVLAYGTAVHVDVYRG